MQTAKLIHSTRRKFEAKERRSTSPESKYIVSHASIWNDVEDAQRAETLAEAKKIAKRLFEATNEYETVTIYRRRDTHYAGIGGLGKNHRGVVLYGLYVDGVCDEHEDCIADSDLGKACFEESP